MAYLIPTLYVIVSYTFFLLPGLFDHVMELKILSILLPFIMGVVNLIIVLTVGRKWTRKTLLNCTLIIKYGLIPFYLIGGSITIGVTVAALFPLPLMALLGLVTIVFLIFGYGILLGASPYALAYIIKSCKEGKHSKIVAILSGICQFLFFVWCDIHDDTDNKGKAFGQNNNLCFWGNVPHNSFDSVRRVCVICINCRKDDF